MLGSRSIWHEGWKAVTTHPTHRRLGQLQRRRVGALPRRRRPLGGQQPRRRAARQAAGARQHLVLGGRRERRLPARRPHAGRDPDGAPAAADRSAQPLRVLPGHGAGQRVAGRQHEEPLVRDRRARRHPGARGRGRALRDRVPLRRPRALRQGQPPPLRQQLRRRRGADDRRHRGHPHRREPDPLGVVREGGDGADVRAPGRCPSTTATRRSARARSRRSSARSRSPARGSSSDGTAASR